MLAACASAVFGVERIRSRGPDRTLDNSVPSKQEDIDPLSFSNPSRTSSRRSAIESDEEAAPATRSESRSRPAASGSKSKGTLQWKESLDRRPIAPPLPTLGEEAEEAEPDQDEADRIPPVPARELTATRKERPAIRGPNTTVAPRRQLPTPVARPQRDQIEADDVDEQPAQRVNPRRPVRTLQASAETRRNGDRVSHPEAIEEESPETEDAASRQVTAEEEVADAEDVESPTAATDVAPPSRVKLERTLSPRARTVAQQQMTPLPEPIRDPKQLRKISAIQPFFDYEPDPERRKDDKCHNLCPRPKQGCPECRKDGKGGVQCLDCPEEVLLSDATLAPRNFAAAGYWWEPTNQWSHPLYFEDPALERYGHTRGCLQPLWSVGRFGVQVFGLPYQMTIDPFCKKRYPLGYYRPGQCVPYKYHQAPLNAEAALVEAGVLTGAFYIFAP